MYKTSLEATQFFLAASYMFLLVMSFDLVNTDGLRVSTIVRNQISRHNNNTRTKKNKYRRKGVLKRKPSYSRKDKLLFKSYLL